MTTTPTAPISTDIAEIGGVTGASAERNAVLDHAIAAVAMKVGECAHIRVVDVFDIIGALKSAAPVVPEPAAAQGDAMTLDDAMRDMLAIQDACGLHTDEYAPGSVIEYIKELEAETPHPLAEVSAAQAVPEWMPIETAPQDGRTLLLGRFNEYGKWRTMRGQWFTKEEIDQDWEDADGFEADWYETAEESDYPNCWAIAPTHWQPTPPAPVAQPTDTTREA